CPCSHSTTSRADVNRSPSIPRPTTVVSWSTCSTRTTAGPRAACTRSRSSHTVIAGIAWVPRTTRLTERAFSQPAQGQPTLSRGRRGGESGAARIPRATEIPAVSQLAIRVALGRYRRTHRVDRLGNVQLKTSALGVLPILHPAIRRHRDGGDGDASGS